MVFPLADESSNDNEVDRLINSTLRENFIIIHHQPKQILSMRAVYVYLQLRSGKQSLIILLPLLWVPLLTCYHIYGYFTFTCRAIILIWPLNTLDDESVISKRKSYAMKASWSMYTDEQCLFSLFTWLNIVNGQPILSILWLANMRDYESHSTCISINCAWNYLWVSATRQ